MSPLKWFWCQFTIMKSILLSFQIIRGTNPGRTWIRHISPMVSRALLPAAWWQVGTLSQASGTKRGIVWHRLGSTSADVRDTASILSFVDPTYILTNGPKEWNPLLPRDTLDAPLKTAGKNNLGLTQRCHLSKTKILEDISQSWYCSPTHKSTTPL